MNAKHLFLILGYFFLLGLGMGNRLAYPQEISAAAEWSLFTTLPPAPVEQTTAYTTQNPAGDVLLPVVGDMLLAHVNKTYTLPPDYVPPDLVLLTGVPAARPEYLRSRVLPYFYQLYGAAREAGYQLSVVSAYRSYAIQAATFSYWVGQYGYPAAVMGSARPGHSEHQLGTAVDLGLAGKPWPTGFSQDPAAGWVGQNAHKFGFVISYPKGKTSVTGYIWEPWHIRFVGVELATKLYEQGLTLEEYLSR